MEAAAEGEEGEAVLRTKMTLLDAVRTTHYTPNTYANRLGVAPYLVRTPLPSGYCRVA